MMAKTGTCYIVGAAPCCDLAAEGFSPGDGDYIIAADGGLRHLEAAGVRPDMIVGDFDTLGYQPDHENVVKLQREKDWTDTFVAMEKGVELGCETFIFYGCLGGKIEHTMANLQHLAWLSQRGLKGWLMGEKRQITAICGDGQSPGRLVLPAREAGLISVLSHTDKAEGVTLKGLKYTLDHGQLTSGFPLGVSNEFTGESAEITVDRGVLIIVIECQ